MWRTPLPFAFALLLTVGALVPLPGDVQFMAPAQAQPPVPLPEPLNNTTIPGAPDPAAPATPDSPYYSNIILHATPSRPYVEIEQGKSGELSVEVADYSLPGAEVTYGGIIKVNCVPVSTTEDGGKWSIIESSPAKVQRNQAGTSILQVSASPFTNPEYFTAEIVCTAGNPLRGQEVGRFNVTARVLPYTFLALRPSDPPPVAGPDEILDYRMLIKNNGNHAKTFYGEVDVPDGWKVAYPEQVVLQPGQEQEITLQLWTPRDKVVYLSESQLIPVSYYPEGEPGKARVYSVAVQVDGVYFHPALVPLTLLTAALIAVLVFFALLARRAVEERILGKPVPPWRIPVEREYLQQLMKEDPDQYYIVRYYLMVEEHQSALLWFEAFKHATKKDRKRESKWYKVKRKQERKVIQLEKGHNKFVAKWDKDTDKPHRIAERKKGRLERKLRRKERKRARKINRRHKKRSKKVLKRHDKKVRKVTKKFEKKREKELKKVEKANRKREKRGEDPLPLPELDPPAFEEPELGEPEVVEEVPLEASRYAKRAARLDARAERKIARLRTRRERAIAKDRHRVDVKTAKLRSRIPPEPETSLYRQDEYVPEDQVVVEDDRSALAKWLFLPTLEEQDRARRRRQIYRADLQRAKEAGDEAAQERLRQEYEAERRERAADRKERLRSGFAQRKEDKRLAAEQRRGLKERARRIKRDETPPAEAGAPDETGSRVVKHKVLPGDAGAQRLAQAKGFKLGRRKSRVPSEQEDVAQEAASAASDES